MVEMREIHPNQDLEGKVFEGVTHIARLVNIATSNGSSPAGGEELVNRSRQFERQYLAFRIIQKGRGSEVVGNLVTEDNSMLPLTGWEGYAAGFIRNRELSVMDYVKQRADFGVSVLSDLQALDNIAYERGEKAMYLKTARGEGFSIPAIYFLHGIVGAELAKMRGKGSGDKTYEEFRDQTYSMINPSAEIEYNKIWEQYLPIETRANNSLGTTVVNLTPKQKKGYIFLAQISPWITSPLLRASLPYLT